MEKNITFTPFSKIWKEIFYPYYEKDPTIWESVVSSF